MDALLLLYPKSNGNGDYDLDRSKIINSKNNNLKYIFTGIQIVKSKIFQKKGKIFPLSKIYDDLIKKKRIYGVVYREKWFHIGTLETLKKYKKMIK